MVLPQALLAPVLKLKGTLDYESNLVMQKALSLYIDNGMFAKNKELLHQQQFIQKSKLLPYSSNIPIRPCMAGHWRSLTRFKTGPFGRSTET